MALGTVRSLLDLFGSGCVHIAGLRTVEMPVGNSLLFGFGFWNGFAGALDGDAYKHRLALNSRLGIASRCCGSGMIDRSRHCRGYPRFGSRLHRCGNRFHRDGCGFHCGFHWCGCRLHRCGNGLRLGFYRCGCRLGSHNGLGCGLHFLDRSGLLRLRLNGRHWLGLGCLGDLFALFITILEN